MKSRLDSICWIETVLASLAAILAAFTIEWSDWLEVLFGIDPDRGSGSSEWAWVFAFGFAAVVLAALATRRWYDSTLTAGQRKGD